MNPLRRFVSFLAKEIHLNPQNWHASRSEPNALENQILGICIRCIWRDDTSHNGRAHIQLYFGDCSPDNLVPLPYDHRCDLWEAAIKRVEELEKAKTDRIYNEADARAFLWMKAKGIDTDEELKPKEKEIIFSPPLVIEFPGNDPGDEWELSFGGPNPEHDEQSFKFPKEVCWALWKACNGAIRTTLDTPRIAKHFGLRIDEEYLLRILDELGMRNIILSTEDVRKFADAFIDGITIKPFEKL